MLWLPCEWKILQAGDWEIRLCNRMPSCNHEAVHAIWQQRFKALSENACILLIKCMWCSADSVPVTEQDAEMGSSFFQKTSALIFNYVHVSFGDIWFIPKAKRLAWGKYVEFWGFNLRWSLKISQEQRELLMWEIRCFKRGFLRKIRNIILAEDKHNYTIRYHQVLTYRKQYFRRRCQVCAS